MHYAKIETITFFSSSSSSFFFSLFFVGNIRGDDCTGHPPYFKPGGDAAPPPIPPGIYAPGSYGVNSSS